MDRMRVSRARWAIPIVVAIIGAAAVGATMLISRADSSIVSEPPLDDVIDAEIGHLDEEAVPEYVPFHTPLAPSGTAWVPKDALYGYDAGSPDDPIRFPMYETKDAAVVVGYMEPVNGRYYDADMRELDLLATLPTTTFEPAPVD